MKFEFNTKKYNHYLTQYANVASGFSGIKILTWIIKTCRLKPYAFLNATKHIKTKLEKNWYDEFGNILHINAEKKAEVIFNDLRMKKKDICCTDLFYGLNKENIVKISKLAYIVIGKDEDLFEDVFIISFLGLDNYLRTFCYIYGEWQRVSNLILGQTALSFINKNSLINDYVSFGSSECSLIACYSQQSWLSCLPVNKVLETTIKHHVDDKLLFLFK